MLPFLLPALLAQAPLTDGGAVVMKGQRFLAEVARTDVEKARGLMYRTNLAKDRCMFFAYDEDTPKTIWMKNCLIALDVAWIDASGQIVEVAERVPPCSPMRGDDCPHYGGKVVSRHFVEFPAGTLRRLRVKVGDRIGWDLRLLDGSRLKGGLPVPAGRGKKR